MNPISRVRVTGNSGGHSSPLKGVVVIVVEMTSLPSGLCRVAAHKPAHNNVMRQHPLVVNGSSGKERGE